MKKSPLLKYIGFSSLIVVAIFSYIYFSVGLPQSAVDSIDKTHQPSSAPEPSGEPSMVDRDLVYFDKIQEQDGVPTLIDLSKTEVVAPNRDDIQPLDQPVFITAQSADKWLSDDAQVALYRGDTGTLVAYPLMILRWHQVVIDDVDGRSIMVSYDPLSGVLALYDRRVNDRTYHFGVSGKVFNGNSLLFDRETESLWQQINGLAVSGTATNEQLTLLPTQLLEWGTVKDRYPAVQVLSRNSALGNDYSVNPYGNYSTIHDIYYKVARLNDVFHPKSQAITLSISQAEKHRKKIYLIQDLAKVGVVNERINGIPLLIVHDRQSGAVAVYDRARPHEKGAYVFRLEKGQLTSKEGSWKVEHEGLVIESKDGLDEPIVLKRIPFQHTYWFSWMAFYPRSQIFTTKLGGFRESVK